MKLGVMRQVLATSLCVAMLCGDILPTAASVSSGDAVDETNVEMNTVSGNDLDEEEDLIIDTVSDGDLDAIVLAKTVNGVEIKLTAPAGSIPEDAVLWAEEVEQSEQLEKIDQALATEEEETDVEVQKYKAFDIKLLVNGEVIQPTEGVKVTFSGDVLLPTSEEENVAVYHVTEDAVASEMTTVVTGDAVEMETEHFSVYVMVLTTTLDMTERTITFNHYLGTPENRSLLFRPSQYTVIGSTCDFAEIPACGGLSYSLQQAVFNGTPYTGGAITLTDTENTIDLYYQEADQTFADQTTFFDYYIDSFDHYEGYKTVTFNQDTMFSSFEYNGEKYTNYKLKDKENAILQKWVEATYWPDNVPAHYEGDPIQLADKDVLTNVSANWTTYAKLTYENGTFHTDEKIVKDTQISFNAGINEGFDTNHPFLAMGRSNNAGTPGKTEGQGYDATGHVGFTITKKDGTKLNFNTNNTTEGKYAIKPGLVSHLDDPNGDKTYPNLVMGKADNGEQIREPGYFTSETSNNKEIYTNYSMHFNQTGNTYMLDYIQNDVPDKEGNLKKTYSYKSATEINDNFFPLDDVTPIGGRKSFEPSGWESGTHNLYFGMRYDFDFNIGDYAGQMIYEFTGDDDLWIFVDGKLALDMGGMHGAYPFSYKWDHTVPEGGEDNFVDLWKFLYGFTTENERLSLTEEQRNEVHTVSILYMERGGANSSCAMKFVIPNVTEKPPVIIEDPKGAAEFTKVDEDGNPLAGAEFGLYDMDGNIVASATSGEDGKVTFKGIDPGEYYVQEKKAPEGYVYSDATYNITIVGNQIVEINGGKIVNTLEPVGAAEFTKVDENNKALAGATFGLYKEGQEEPVQTAESGTDGKVKFENITPGEYYVQEITAPDDYKLDNTKYPVTIEEDGLAQVNSGTIKNVPYTGSVEFTKMDGSNKTPVALKGAVFGLFTESGQKIAEATSQNNGKVTFANVNVGNYYVQEVSAPAGFQLDPNKYPVVVKADETATVNVGSANEGVIYNYDDTFSFFVWKRDGMTGDPIEGAKFELWTDDSEKKCLATVTSLADGKVVFAGLPNPGSGAATYLIKEIAAADGYELPTGTQWKIQVKFNKNNVKISIQESSLTTGEYGETETGEMILFNNREDVTINIEKKWLDINGNEGIDPAVDSIEVDLYRHQGTSAEEFVETITLAKADGWKYTKTGLPYGNENGKWTYSVKEKKVDGYKLNRIDYDEETSTFTIVNQAETGSLKITKTVDKVNMVYGAASFTFKIMGPDGKFLYRTLTFDDKTGTTQSLIIDNLPLGQYTVLEMENIRYKLDEVSVVVDGVETKCEDKAVFEVKADKTSECKFKNVQGPDKYYSHSDIVVNSFRQNADGSINISKNVIVIE